MQTQVMVGIIKFIKFIKFKRFKKLKENRIFSYLQAIFSENIVKWFLKQLLCMKLKTQCLSGR